MKKSSFTLPIFVSVAVIILLSAVQLNVERPLIMLERLFEGGGWIEIIIIALYAGFLANKMQDPSHQAKWRVRSWTIFSIVFFTQLVLGLIGFENFLMTGKLHLPIPMMIVAGPVFRGEIAFMPILFLSTILLSGPAWCSQLCYFGAIDAQLSKIKSFPQKAKLANITSLKFSGLAIVIATAITLKMFNVALLYTTLIAALFGVIGVIIILVYSRKKGKMVHCIAWCPVGTVVNYLKYINPFRFKISSDCTSCMKCVPVCRYDALKKEDIELGKPGITCTLCGDCMPVCKPNAFYYKFPGMGPDVSRKLYLGVTIILHALFLALARM